MLIKVVTVILISVAIGILFLVFFVDGVFQKSFADFMIGLFTFLGLSHDDANFLYFRVFMNQKDMWLLIGLLIIMAVAFYISLSRFTKYFTEISDGVDKLTEDDEETIKLSDELDFMEDKLNEVKYNLKKKDRDAKDAEQRKNDLVVYLAHDIKTPLTSVIGYLNLLNESPNLSLEDRAKYTNITMEKAYRLEELINEFFDITRFNLQSIVLDKTDIDIDLMLRQVADEFYPSFEAKGLSVSVAVEDALTIKGDSQKLARVINNIIRNAISYSNEGGEILINAKDADTHIIIRITNTGETIPEDKLEAIFEKFYRLDKSRSTHKGGSGLGLAIAKEIVASHGGEISVTSRDSKTTFTIFLPKK